MDSVLIVSNASSTMAIISDLLRSETFGKISVTQSGSEARRYINESDFDLVIIDTPLLDEHGKDFAIFASEKIDAGIILIVNESDVIEIGAEVEDFGVFTLPKPISSEFFYQAVKLLSACKKRVAKLENENLKLQKKIEEIKTVDRAKILLVQTLKMTEEQAHHYIEKQSMDLRKTRLETAEKILKTMS